MEHDPTRKKSLHAGLALTLLALLLFLATRHDVLLYATTVLLILCMATPSLFGPFARVWFPLSSALGRISTALFLSAVFVFLVIPVGLIRKAIGKDTLKLKSGASGSRSFFTVRQHRFSSADLENPY